MRLQVGKTNFYPTLARLGGTRSRRYWPLGQFWARGSYCPRTNSRTISDWEDCLREDKPLLTTSAYRHHCVPHRRSIELHRARSLRRSKIHHADRYRRSIIPTPDSDRLHNTSRGNGFPFQSILCQASEMQIVAVNPRKVGENLLLELVSMAVSGFSSKAILCPGSHIEASGS